MHKSFAVVLPLVLLCGCDHTENRNATEQASEINSLSNRIASLSAEVANLKHRIDTLESVAKYTSQHLYRYNSVVLTPDSNGYLPLETSTGKLLISLADITPYASGSRISLQIGNLSTGSHVGAKFFIEWGPIDESGQPKVEAGSFKEYAINETLRPGTWTTVTIPIEKTPPAKLGAIRISSTSSGMINLR